MNGGNGEMGTDKRRKLPLPDGERAGVRGSTLITKFRSTFYFALCILQFSICTFVPSIHAASCKWIETTGDAVVENITPEEARQEALSKARLKAVEGVAGIDIQSGSMVKDFTLVADFIRSKASGAVVEEKVLGWDSKTIQEKSDQPPLTVYKVNLKTCVAAVPPGDPYFKVKASLNRPVFMTGEEAAITASCSKDCFLTILNLTADGKMNVLLPNQYEKSSRIKVGETYHFPSQGLGLEMGTLPGHRRDTEAFYIIATKEKMNLTCPVKKSGEVTAAEFYKDCLSLPAETRAEEMLVYEVRAKE